MLKYVLPSSVCQLSNFDCHSLVASPWAAMFSLLFVCVYVRDAGTSRPRKRNILLMTVWFTRDGFLHLNALLYISEHACTTYHRPSPISFNFVFTSMFHTQTLVYQCLLRLSPHSFPFSEFRFGPQATASTGKSEEKRILYYNVKDIVRACVSPLAQRWDR